MESSLCRRRAGPRSRVTTVLALVCYAIVSASLEDDAAAAFKPISASARKKTTTFSAETSEQRRPRRPQKRSLIRRHHGATLSPQDRASLAQHDARHRHLAPDDNHDPAPAVAPEREGEANDSRSKLYHVTSKGEAYADNKSSSRSASSEDGQTENEGEEKGADTRADSKENEHGREDENAKYRWTKAAKADEGEEYGRDEKLPEQVSLALGSPQEDELVTDGQLETARRANFTEKRLLKEGFVKKEKAAYTSAGEVKDLQNEDAEVGKKSKKKNYEEMMPSARGMMDVSWVSPGKVIKSVSASSISDTEHGPEKSFDRNPLTWWQALKGSGMLSFELSRHMRVGGFRVRQAEKAPVGAFSKIVVSSSAEGWTWVPWWEGTAADKKCCDFQDFDFPTKSSRFWKFEFKDTRRNMNVTVADLELKTIKGEIEGYDISRLLTCENNGSFTEHGKCGSQVVAREQCESQGLRLCSIHEVAEEIGRACRYMWTSSSAKLGYHVGNGRKNCGISKDKLYASTSTKSGIGMFDAACCILPVTTTTSTMSPMIAHEQFGTYRLEGQGGCATDMDLYPESQTLASMQSTGECRKACDQEPGCGAYAFGDQTANSVSTCHLYPNVQTYTKPNGAFGMACWFRKGKIFEHGQTFQETTAWRSGSSIVDKVSAETPPYGEYSEATDDDGFEADNVLKDDSRFWKVRSDKAKLMFKLYGSIRLGGIAIKMPSNMPGSAFEEFMIEFSHDGQAWETVKQSKFKDLGCCNLASIVWTPVSARFWRINMLKNHGSKSLTVQYVEFLTSIAQTSCTAFLPNLKLDWADADDMMMFANVGARRAGATPFASGSMQGQCTMVGPGMGSSVAEGEHCFHNINDGVGGAKSSWVPGNAFQGQQFVGVQLHSQKRVHGIRISTPTTNADAIGGWYHVQYTSMPAANYKTANSAWCTIGSFTRSKPGTIYKQFSTVVEASAIRIVVTDWNIMIDELGVYGEVDDLPVTEGLVADMRASTFSPGSKGERLWGNQVPNSHDAGDVPKGVTFDSGHQAFSFLKGGPVIKLPLMTDALHMKEITYTAWVRLSADEDGSCVNESQLEEEEEEEDDEHEEKVEQEELEQRNHMQKAIKIRTDQEEPLGGLVPFRWMKTGMQSMDELTKQGLGNPEAGSQVTDAQVAMALAMNRTKQMMADGGWIAQVPQRNAESKSRMAQIKGNHPGISAEKGVRWSWVPAAVDNMEEGMRSEMGFPVAQELVTEDQLLAANSSLGLTIDKLVSMEWIAKVDDTAPASEKGTHGTIKRTGTFEEDNEEATNNDPAPRENWTSSMLERSSSLEDHPDDDDKEPEPPDEKSLNVEREGDGITRLGNASQNSTSVDKTASDNSDAGQSAPQSPGTEQNKAELRETGAQAHRARTSGGYISARYEILNLLYQHLLEHHKQALRDIIVRNIAWTTRVLKKHISVELTNGPGSVRVAAMIKAKNAPSIIKVIRANGLLMMKRLLPEIKSIAMIKVAEDGVVDATPPTVVLVPNCALRDSGRGWIVSQIPDYGRSRALVLRDWAGQTSIKAGQQWNSSVGKPPIGEWFFVAGVWNQHNDSYVYLNAANSKEPVTADNTGAGNYKIIYHHSMRCLGLLQAPGRNHKGEEKSEEGTQAMKVNGDKKRKDSPASVIFQRDCQPHLQNIALQWMPGRSGSGLMKFLNGQCAKACRSGAECGTADFNGSARVIAAKCNADDPDFQFSKWEMHEGYFQLVQMNKITEQPECAHPLHNSGQNGVLLVMGDCAIDESTLFNESRRDEFEQLSIGGRYDNEDKYNANLMISDVAVYNRSLRSDEIAKLYSFGRPSTPVDVVMHCPPASSGVCVQAEYKEWCEYLVQQHVSNCDEFCGKHEEAQCVGQFQASTANSCARGVEGDCNTTVLPDGQHICRCVPRQKPPGGTIPQDLVYGLGRDRAVYSQMLYTMHENSDWEVAAPCCVISIAVTSTTLYGVTSDFKIVKMSLDNLKPNHRSQAKKIESGEESDFGTVSSGGAMGDGVSIELLDSKLQWEGAGDCCARSITIHGNDIYAVGKDLSIYKQPYATMTLATKWIQAGRCCVTSIAFSGNNAYATGEDGQVYMQTISNMETSRPWLLTGQGGVNSIMIVGPRIYAAASDDSIYEQDVGSMTMTSNWELAGKCCMKATTSTASLQMENTTITTRVSTTTFPSWEPVALLDGADGKICRDTTNASVGQRDVYEVQTFNLTHSECAEMTQNPPLDSNMTSEHIRFYQFCSSCVGKNMSNCHLVKYCADVNDDPGETWRLFVNVNKICPALWLQSGAGLRRMTRACEDDNFPVTDELECQELAFKNRSSFYQYCENCEESHNWCCHQTEECACYTGGGWPWRVYKLAPEVLASEDGDPCKGYDFDLKGPWKPENGR